MRELSNLEFRKKLAELQSRIAIKEAQIMADPVPYLSAMSNQCNTLLKVIDDIAFALSPDLVFDYWDTNMDKGMVPNPIDVQGEALLRCNAALEVIRKYREGPTKQTKESPL